MASFLGAGNHHGGAAFVLERGLKASCGCSLQGGCASPWSLPDDGQRPFPVLGRRPCLGQVLGREALVSAEPQTV
jgi:hypothetical protein